jgi:hypothetical protein
MIKQPSILPIFDDGRHAYQVAATWEVRVDEDAFRVPTGFVCDGASVPRLLWWLYPPDGLWRAAALVHDWLYATKGKRPFTFALSRAECDGIFREVMLRCQVRARQAQVMWMGVRLGGWVPWRRSSGVPRIERLKYEIE